MTYDEEAATDKLDAVLFGWCAAGNILTQSVLAQWEAELAGLQS